ncbi:hypothetical protein BT96DRAFT_946659 [Gymnopus androsaceus JB14]|uniref:Aspergillopepsin n=1 Tax=Gymnopus androsaceus JB14 TaxID=1447944 RepID=A0A6A4GWB3_9AGAR|nr:hypothetical protein BT96DRAFT_946659 [Gymnopus androsaceus JB14]
MKFSAIFISSALLLAESTLGSSLGNRLSRRTSGRKSQPIIQSAEQAAGSNTTQTEFSQNWSGVVLESPPAGETFNKVVGTFTIPSVSGSGAASAWVGIDGDTYADAILQAGVDFTIDDGDVSFDAWYEWFPDVSHDFTDFDMSEGDEIKITIAASTLSEGKVTIENVSTGKSVSKAPLGSIFVSYSNLGGQNAEWIVEDFEEGDSLVKFCDFGTVKFTDASASTAESTVGVTGGTVIDIEQSSKVLTAVTVDSDSSITIAYK